MSHQIWLINAAFKHMMLTGALVVYNELPTYEKLVRLADSKGWAKHYVSVVVNCAKRLFFLSFPIE